MADFRKLKRNTPNNSSYSQPYSQILYPEDYSESEIDYEDVIKEDLKRHINYGITGVAAYDQNRKVDSYKNSAAIAKNIRNKRRELYDKHFKNSKTLLQEMGAPEEAVIDRAAYYNYINATTEQLANIGRQMESNSSYAKLYGSQFKTQKAQMNAGLDFLAISAYNEDLAQSFVNDDITSNELAALKKYQPEKYKALTNFINANKGNLANALSEFHSNDSDFSEIDNLAEQWRNSDNYAQTVDPGSFINTMTRDKVAEGMNWKDYIGRTLEGTVNSGVSVLANTAGIIYGLGSAVVNTDANKILDNTVTQWSNRLFTTGSWNPEEQERLEELGLSKTELVGHSGSANIWQDVGTLIQNEGFTLGAMGAGKGLRLLSQATRLYKLSQLINRGNKAMRVANGIITPAIDAMALSAAEANLEAYTARHEFTKGAEQYLDKIITQEAQKNVLQNKQTPEYEEGFQDYLNGYSMKFSTNKENPYEQSSWYEDAEGNKYSLEDLNREYYLERVSQEIDKLKSNDTYSQAADAIAEKAANVYYGTFWINEGILGAVRSTLTAGLYQSGMSQRLKRNRLFGTRSKIGKKLGWGEPNYIVDGDKVRIDRGKWGNIRHNIYTYGKLPAGEGLEEVGQYMGSSFMQDTQAIPLFDTINALYDVGGYDTMLEYENTFAGVMKRITKPLSDSQLRKEGLMGFFGGIIAPGAGHKVTSARTGNMSYWDKGIINGRVESNWDYINRTMLSYITPGKGYVQSIREEREEEANRLGLLTAFVNDEELKQQFQSAAGILNFEKIWDEISSTDDTFQTKNVKLAKLVHGLYSLYHLDNKAYTDEYLSIIDKAAGGKLSEQEIDQLYNQAIEDAVITKDVSKDEFIQNLTKNAGEIQSVVGDIQSAIDKIEDETEEYDWAVKEGLVMTLTQIKDWERRLNEIKEVERNLDRSQIQDTEVGERPQLTKEQKRLVIRLGNKQGLQQAKKQLEGRIDKLNKLPKKSKEQKNELKEVQEQLKNINDLAETLGDSWYTFTENEILDLDHQDRSILLRRAIEPVQQGRQLSHEDVLQKQVFDNLRSVLNYNNQNTVSALADQYRIEQAIKINKDIYNKAVNKSIDMNAYVYQARLKGEEYFLNKRKDSILHSPTYQDYIANLKGLLEDNNLNIAQRMQIVTSLMQDRDNPYKEDYNANAQISRYLKEFFNESENKNLYTHAINYLNQKGFNFNQLDLNSNDIYSALQGQRLFSEEFRQYIAEQEKGKKDFDRTIIPEAGNPLYQLENDFKQALSLYRTSKKILDDTHKEVTVDTSTPVKPTPQVQHSETPAKGTKTVSNFKSDLKEFVEKSDQIPSELKDKLNTLIDSIDTSYQTVNDLQNALDQIEIEDPAVKAAFHLAKEYATSKYEERKAEYQKKQAQGKQTEAQQKQDEDPVEITQQEDLPSMTLEHLDNLDHNLDSPLGEYVRVHDIVKFLRDYKWTGNETINFVYDPAIQSIVAVIEHAIGNINIDGKTYQVVSILSNSSKSAWNEALYKLVQNTSSTEPFIVKGEGGQAITSKPQGTAPVKANPTEYHRKNDAENDTPVDEAIRSNLTENERKEVGDNRESPTWKSAVARFLRRLYTAKDKTPAGKKRTKLVYNQENFRDDHGQAIEVFVAPVSSRVGSSTDGFIYDTYLKPFINDLIKFIKSDLTEWYNTSTLFLTMEDSGATIKKVNNPNGSQSIIFSSDTYGDVILIQDIEEKVDWIEVVKKLLFDENGDVRRVGKEEFWKFNVVYPDPVNDPRKPYEEETVIQAYENGLLLIAANRLDFAIEGIRMDKPANLEIKKQENTFLQRAIALVQKIQSRSKQLHLSQDGQFYEDEQGNKYLRTTSIITTREDGERFDPNSPWTLPSTSIGNAVDELVRDIFGDKVTSDSLGKRPNMSEQSGKAFAEQVEALKNQLISQGLYLVASDVTVHGQVPVVKKDGTTEMVNVAGTLDVLAYDANGNFYIYDMKTHRSDSVEDKKDKWAAQLSLYATLLKQQYGIDIKSIGIIPIKVEYPAPSDVTYTEENGQLKADKKPLDSTPKLEAIIPLKTTTFIYNFDKLTDSEKEMLGIEEAESIDVGEGTDLTEGPINIPTVDVQEVLNNFRESMKFRSFRTHLTEEVAEKTDDWDDLSKEEQRKALENYWLSLSDEERENKMDCYV